MTGKTCPVCVNLQQVCNEVGEGSYCADLFKKLDEKEIDTHQFVNELIKNEKIAKRLKVKKPSQRSS